MTGEINLGGVYVHPLLIAAMLAFILAELIGWGLSRTGFYRLVWHRGLFDVAMTVILWAALAAFLTGGSLSAALIG